MHPVVGYHHLPPGPQRHTHAYHVCTLPTGEINVFINPAVGSITSMRSCLFLRSARVQKRLSGGQDKIIRTVQLCCTVTTVYHTYAQSQAHPYEQFWRSGSAFVSINKVNVSRAPLVMGDRVRVQFPVRTSISVRNQPRRSTQPGHPFVGGHNEYQPMGGDALRLGSKGRYGSCV